MGNIGAAKQINEAIRDGPKSSSDLQLYLTDISRLLREVHKYLLTNRDHSPDNLSDIRDYLTTIYLALDAYLPEDPPLELDPTRWQGFRKEVSNNLIKRKYSFLIEALDLYSSLVAPEGGTGLREPKTLKQLDSDKKILSQRRREFFDKFKDFADRYDKLLKKLR